MAYDADLIALIDQRIRANQSTSRATGTCVDRATTGPNANVTFDGSTVAMPVKVLGNVFLQAGDRCVLDRYGSDWVVSGSWSSLGYGESSTLAFGPASGINISTTSFVDYDDVPAFTFDKIYDATYVRMATQLTCYTDSSVIARWALRWTALDASSTYAATDYNMNYMSMTTDAGHTFSYHCSRAASIPAGRYSIQLRWRKISGAGTVRSDGNDLHVVEIDEGVRASAPFL